MENEESKETFECILDSQRCLYNTLMEIDLVMMVYSVTQVSMKIGRFYLDLSHCFLDIVSKDLLFALLFL